MCVLPKKPYFAMFAPILSPKSERPVSATPTHMLRICVNPSFNSFCRLAATGANKVLRPSHYSLTTATGLKRSSADSDSLLCHVGLWRTSRLIFWRRSRCEHSKIRVILIVSSAHILDSRPPPIFQRACRQCVHESARLLRALCSLAW